MSGQPGWTSDAVIAGPCEESGRPGVLVQLDPKGPLLGQLRELCADPTSPFPLRATAEAGSAALVAVEPAPTAPVATAAELAGLWLPADASRLPKDRGLLIRADGTITGAKVVAERTGEGGLKIVRVTAGDAVHHFRITPETLVVEGTPLRRLEWTVQRTGGAIRLVVQQPVDGGKLRRARHAGIGTQIGIEPFERSPAPPPEPPAVGSHPPSAHDALLAGPLPPKERLELLDKNYETPLMWAVVRGHTAIARELLAHGANPNAGARSERAPLTVAAARGDAALVELLLERGADPEVYADAKSAHALAMEGWHLDVARTIAIHGGVALGDLMWLEDPEVVQEYLRRAPALRRQPKDLAAALNSAAGRGSFDVVAVLLAAGADPNGYTLGSTTLCAAARSGSVATVRLLLAAGADRNARGADGATAVECAARSELDDVAAALDGSRAR